ncbi:ankyrin repeat-containing protein BDA1-like isoform X3 [Carex rostrata]
MDTLFTRLEEASHVGDVNVLKELLNQDKLLLDKVIVRTSVIDNPLHIASMLGHADFVREIIYHKPEIAKELNSQGLSPLHLAAGCGHVTVVKELLKASRDLCLLSETHEGLFPLHIAVKKRRAVVVKMLVEACEEAVNKLTNCGETILHLALKNNSFDTVEFLIDRVNDLNAKDDRGNTILHHAVARKQLSVIKILLNKTTMNVNVMNCASLTPLDVLLGSWPQNEDLVLGEMIRAAGGKTAAELLSEAEPVMRDTFSNPIPIPRMSLRRPVFIGSKNDIEDGTLELQKKKKEKRYDPQILLLVATLVATVTFQAALNPPGGFKPDGQPVLGDSLNYFQVYDMIALFLSVSVMMLLLCVVPRKRNIAMKFLVWVIWYAALFMGVAFTMGISAIYDVEYNYKRINKKISYNPKNWACLLLNGWDFLSRFAMSWVLVTILIFVLKKSGLWETVQLHFASLKRGCFLKWQQFSNIRNLNVSNCCQLFKNVICIVLILGVLVGLSYIWILSFS